MARIKSAPVVAQELPTSQKVMAAGNSISTPSGSFSSTSTNPTCPNCQSVFQDMSITDFRDHVADCSRPTTADGDDATSSSPLSSPPMSPSQQTSSRATGVLEEVVEEVSTEVHPAPVATQPAPGVVEEPAAEEVTPNVEQNPIRAYVHNEFVFYPLSPVAKPGAIAEEPELLVLDNGDLEPAGEKEVDAGSPPNLDEPLDLAEISQSPLKNGKQTTSKAATTKLPYPFKNLTPISVFEEYLSNPDELTYDEVYARSAVVNDVLADIQAEADAIEKEIRDHDYMINAKAKEVDEEGKKKAEQQRALDDKAREKVQLIYADQLKYETKEWQQFITARKAFAAQNPEFREEVQHLLDLKNPVFMAAFHKRQRVAAAKPKEDNFEGAPWPDVKLTKEEIAAEKRKFGRLVDRDRYDDMIMADAYGFEYSAHIKHVGAQPVSDNLRRSKAQAKLANGSGSPASNDIGETGRSRRNRNGKRPYAVEQSVTPESEDDGLPAKRARKPKIFEDGVESIGRSRPNPSSRGGTPAIRTFASGKRVGRPPTKSKLQAVQMAPRSESPLPPIADNGDANGPTNGTVPRDLGPSAEAALHDAAESLVNQTVVDNTVVVPPPAKKKHPGGRPRKYPPPNTVLPPPPPTGGTLIPDLAINKPRNKGGRPRKIRTESTQSTIKLETAPQDEIGVLQSTEQDDGPQQPTGSDTGRSKRKRTTTDTDTSPIVVDDSHVHVASPNPPPKRRRARVKQDDDQDELDAAIAAPSKSKRDTTFSRGSTAVDSPDMRSLSRKNHAPTLNDEEDSDSSLSESDGIDTSQMTPTEFKEYIANKKQRQKSKKLSRSMKRRWKNGGMLAAQETRRKNNAMKKAARDAALAAGYIPGAPTVPTTTYVSPFPPLAAPPTDSPTPAPTAPTRPTPRAAPPPKAAASKHTPTHKATPKLKREPSRRRSKPSPQPPPARVSTRVRKPARGRRPASSDDDDDEDEDDEIDQQFASEYDRFQALTSPRSPVVLGKRARKSLVDLSMYAYDTEDDELSGEEEYDGEEDDD